MFSLEHLQTHMKPYFRDMPALIKVKAEYLQHTCSSCQNRKSENERKGAHE